MATYYNGNTNSEIQSGDGLQTLVLMNPGYVYYPESSQQQQQSGNFVFLDHSNNPGNNNNNNNNNNHQHQQQQHGNNSMSHAPPAPSAQQTQQFVGIPLSASPPSSVHSQHDVSSLHAFIPRAHQYMYTPVEMVPAAQPHQREVTPFQQGLSLSLSSQQSRFGSARIPISPTGDQDGRAAVGGGSTSSASGISNSVNGMHNMLLNSKYLKATQEILEEVVNVGKVALKDSDPSIKNLQKGVGSGDDGSPLLITGEGTSRDEATTKSGGGPELTTAERQEIQMKKAKLVNMLDEVEQRYRQYHHQMQIVISWFEQAAGIGSAKTYTALALQTISKQFRCLKDAIMGQIKAASRSLGEEDSLGGGKTEGSGSRLKFVDNQIRQQRALQQLGMMQHNAWRPQRGLPERSVSVLRAWLFEHFLHPYPKDSDKHMLAKQTGLTRSQVSNWFINARVRLWKPMVEEMYLEEIKEQEQNGMEDPKSGKNEENQEHSASKGEKSLSPENSNRGYRATKQENSFHAPPPMTVSTSVSTSPNATGINFQNPSGFSLLGSLEMEGITQFSPKKPRNDDRQQQNQNEGGGFTLTGSNPTDFMGGLGGYPIGEIGRFTTDQFQQQYSGNGVSLTLGLPHCENLSISGSHQSFLPNQSIQLSRGAELGEENDYGAMNPPSSSHSAAMYDSMNIQNRKRFAAQPLPDFVA